MVLSKVKMRWFCAIVACGALLLAVTCGGRRQQEPEGAPADTLQEGTGQMGEAPEDTAAMEPDTGVSPAEE